MRVSSKELATLFLGLASQTIANPLANNSNTDPKNLFAVNINKEVLGVSVKSLFQPTHTYTLTYLLSSPSPKAEVTRFEEAVIQGGPVALPGATALIQQLQAGNPDNNSQRHAWTIVTSATS